MSSATYLTGFLRLSRSPNPAVKVGKKVRGRERIEVVAAVGSLLHAYLRISSVIGARARSFPKSLTSSHFLFINGNGEKRACVRRSEGGRRKNFLEEVEDNHLGFVGPTLAPSPAPFWRQKGKKVGKSNSISPSLLRSFFFASLFLYPSFMAKFVFQLSESLQTGKAAAALVVAFGFSVLGPNELKLL